MKIPTETLLQALARARRENAPEVTITVDGQTITLRVSKPNVDAIHAMGGN